MMSHVVLCSLGELTASTLVKLVASLRPTARKAASAGRRASQLCAVPSRSTMPAATASVTTMSDASNQPTLTASAATGPSASSAQAVSLPASDQAHLPVVILQQQRPDKRFLARVAALDDVWIVLVRPATPRQPRYFRTTISRRLLTAWLWH
jgi:hypothetical protein